jgi:hypothetical protein
MVLGRRKYQRLIPTEMIAVKILQILVNCSTGISAPDTRRVIFWNAFKPK